MYQFVEYDRHLEENQVTLVLLADAPIIPAYQLGQRVDGVQISVDGVEMPVDRSFDSKDAAAAHMTKRIAELQDSYGMAFEELPRTAYTAPSVVTVYRALN